MNDPLERSAYFRKQRECLYCHHPLSEKRPLFLVCEPGGRILGPFHHGCGTRLVDHARKHPTSNWLQGAVEYGTWPTRREETLPE